MSTKKDTKQISDYYKKKNVVDSYENRRFKGQGGSFINRTELVTLLKPIVSISKGKPSVNVLDLGAGKGRLTEALVRLPITVYALDFSSEMIMHLNSFLSKDKLLQQSIFEPIKLKKKFDVITSLRFFDHFSLTDQEKILKNVLNNLENEGTIVFSCLSSHSIEALISKFFPYGRYNYFYSDSEYKAVFTNLKLKVIANHSSFFLPRGLFLYVSNPLVTSFLIKLESFLSSTFPQANALQVYTLKRIL